MTISTEKSWEHFWGGSPSGGAYACDGRSHPALDQAWLLFFSLALQGRAGPLKSLDLAAGSGMLIGYLLQAGTGAAVEMHCLDSSPAAIASIKLRFPAVVGHVADARQTGLADGAYDIVTSQFGIEYAGAGALGEAMRLVRPGGHLGLVMHCKDGRIETDGRHTRDAVARVLQAGLMQNAILYFAAAFVHQARGQGLAQLERAAAALQLSMDTSLQVVHQYGAGIANHAIARLLDDIGIMAGDVRGYDEGATMQWLEGMHGQMRALHGRMAALCEAAADGAAFAQLQAAVGAAGFEIVRAGLLDGSGGSGALAWCLHARKS